VVMAAAGAKLGQIPETSASCSPVTTKPPAHSVPTDVRLNGVSLDKRAALRATGFGTGLPICKVSHRGESWGLTRHGSGISR
jgi:hypothetical protein